MSHAQLAALLALAALATGCHNAAPTAIDGVMASCVPADTVVLGGIDCERLRASPMFRKLPAAVTALLEPLRSATYLLLASNGKDYLAIGRGPFGQAPPGATPLAPDLAILGSPDAVRAATAQHRRGVAGAPGLGGRAGSLAGGRGGELGGRPRDLDCGDRERHAAGERERAESEPAAALHRIRDPCRARDGWHRGGSHRGVRHGGGGPAAGRGTACDG